MSNTKHTPGPWDAGYGHKSKSYGVFTKRMLDYGYEEPPICLISPIKQLTDKDEANAKLIAAAPRMKDGLYKAYLMLQKLSNENIDTAIITDTLRAELRNILSNATGQDDEELQLEIEKKASE